MLHLKTWEYLVIADAKDILKGIEKLRQKLYKELSLTEEQQGTEYKVLKISQQIEILIVEYTKNARVLV